jgi:hypothetical protein
MASRPTAPLGSPAFLDDLAQRLARLAPASGRRVGLGQVVTGPEGEHSWTIFVGGGEPAKLVEGISSADVCLVADEETAWRLLEGAPPSDLLAEGRVKVRGNATALVEGQEALTAVASALTAASADEDA